MSAELCETRNLPFDTVYTTLSHLWGDNQIFQLRQSNIEKLRESIPVRQLPQTFQDAMYVSMELGIDYIWIDSLCIVQDSKKDWDYEAKRMGDVYQYAACNIAAAGYKDNSPTLLRARKALSQKYPPIFSDVVLISQGRRRGWHHFTGLYIRADDDAFLHDIVDNILNSRAWVAQERALSPGILHFTPEMIWWECNDLVANEAFPTGHLMQHDPEFMTCTIRQLAEKGDPERVYVFWRKFIRLYAAKELTYEKDRFPAVLGLARTLSELIDDNFVAGFWEGDLINSLLMQRDGEIEDIPSIRRAPSWSWASLRKGYLPYSMDETYDITPLSGVRITVLSDLPGFKSDLDSMSPDSSGVRGLEITAPLRKLPVGTNLEVNTFSAPLRGWTDLDFSRNDDTSSLSIPESEAWRLCDPTHLLVLTKDWGYPWNIARGLLLQQTSEAENTFRKLGVLLLRFGTEEEMEEHLGLKKDEGNYIPSPVFGECGFQKLVLI